MSLPRLRVLRIMSVLLSLCLLLTTSAPALAWACEGAAYEYQGFEAGKQIAAGSTVAKVIAAYNFKEAGQKTVGISCKKEEYTWQKQGPAKTFVFKPSYEECGEAGTNNKVPNINVGTCEYQFNAPTFLAANRWETSLSIIKAGGCEVKIKLNAEKCEVKIKNVVGGNPVNQNVFKVLEKNNGNNLIAEPFVEPLAYAVAMGSVCPVPIGGANSELEYISTSPELKNINIAKP